jgi:hypothetical protein
MSKTSLDFDARGFLADRGLSKAIIRVVKRHAAVDLSPTLLSLLFSRVLPCMVLRMAYQGFNFSIDFCFGTLEDCICRRLRCGSKKGSRGKEPGPRSAGCKERQDSERFPKLASQKRLVGRSREFEAERAEGRNKCVWTSTADCAHICGFVGAARQMAGEAPRFLPPGSGVPVDGSEEAVNGMHAPLAGNYRRSHPWKASGLDS